MHLFAYPRGDPMEVVFPGYERRPHWPYKPVWAALGGYDHVEWLPDQGDETVTLNRLPRVGEQRMLLVRPPFQASRDERFWLLYKPTLSWLNGWATHPEELLQSALLGCSLLSVDAMTSRNAILTVRVDDVITIPQISQRFPPDKAGDIGAFEWHREYLWRTDYEPYRVVDINQQSAGGMWVVCQRQGSGWVALIYGEWVGADSMIYIGHRPLSAAEVAIIGLEAQGLRSG
jgi:hypothetical protein